MNERKPLKPQQALERLAAACAKTEYCEDDLRRKMAQWLVPAQFHDEIIATLRGGKFIDDGRYCRAYTEDKWRFNQWGKMKIRMNLRMKHLPDADIENAIAEIPDGEYRETLAQLLRQKERTLHGTEGNYGKYQKLIRYAMGRGFDPDTIRECLERNAGE